MSELLPCPFDGAMAVVELCSQFGRNPILYEAGCCECAAATFGSSREEAVAAWNRRASKFGPAVAALFRFYAVDTLEALVEAQARHIEKLQAKLPPMRDTQPGKIREG